MIVMLLSADAALITYDFQGFDYCLLTYEVGMPNNYGRRSLMTGGDRRGSECGETINGMPRLHY